MRKKNWLLNAIWLGMYDSITLFWRTSSDIKKNRLCPLVSGQTGQHGCLRAVSNASPFALIPVAPRDTLHVSAS